MKESNYWYYPGQYNPSDLDFYFLVNGNIYNQSLPMGQYKYLCGWECSWSLFGWCLSGETPVYCSGNTTTPQPPYLYIAKSYQNAYETAFEAEQEKELNLYPSGYSNLWILTFTVY